MIGKQVDKQTERARKYTEKESKKVRKDQKNIFFKYIEKEDKLHKYT